MTEKAEEKKIVSPAPPLRRIKHYMSEPWFEQLCKEEPKTLDEYLKIGRQHLHEDQLRTFIDYFRIINMIKKS